MLKENKNTTTDKTYGNHDIAVPNAADVNSAPFIPPPTLYRGLESEVINITDAVIKQTIIVSMKGPIIATMPSLTGSSVFAAEWAIDADPTPPSLLKTALLTPVTKAPIKPPYAASGTKAWLNIDDKPLEVFLN